MGRLSRRTSRSISTRSPSASTSTEREAIGVNTPTTVRATRSAYTYLRAPIWRVRNAYIRSFAQREPFGGKVDILEASNFPTPGVMHDAMDHRRDHIQTDDTVQFVKAFCRCSEILGFEGLGTAL